MKIDAETIVAKHDSLIKANYKLTVNEQRLILTLIALIHPEDSEFKRYSLKISDLCRLLKLNKKSIADRRKSFQSILNSLQRNLLEIVFQTQGRSILKTPAWIEEPEFDWEMDLVTLRISETLKPYLLQLRKNGRFASYRLRDISNFRCEYSFRLLEFCRNFEPRFNFYDLVIDNRYVKKLVYQLPDLKKVLGIPVDQYPRPYDFQKKVLSRAQAEVHKHTSCYFEFEFLKTGRSATGVVLKIFGGMIAVKKVALNESQKLQRDRAKNLGASLSFATKFVVEYRHKPEQVWQAIMAVEEYREWLFARNQTLKFAASSLKKSLFEGWHSRRWHEQQQRELQEKLRQAQEADRAALGKALAKLAARKKTEDRLQNDQWELEEERQKQKYKNDQAVWAIEYDKLGPDQRADFILSVLPADVLEDLSTERLEKLKKTVVKFTKTGGYAFQDVYDVSFSLLLECLLPVA